MDNIPRRGVIKSVSIWYIKRLSDRNTDRRHRDNNITTDRKDKALGGKDEALAPLTNQLTEAR